MDHSPFAIRIRYSLFAIRYVLENAQNGKGQLLAEVGMDMGSPPRSLGIGAECAGRTRSSGRHMKVINSLVSQLRGRLGAGPNPTERGAGFEVIFPT